MSEMQNQLKPKYLKKTDASVQEFKRKFLEFDKDTAKKELDNIKEIFYYEKKAAARKSERLYKIENILETIEKNSFENFICASVCLLGYYGSAGFLVGSIVSYLKGDVDTFKNLFKISVLFGGGATVFLGVCRLIEQAANYLIRKCTDKELEIYEEIRRTDKEIHNIEKEIK
ncbi:MAG: hypothetical protein QW500_04010 [Candidatus Micrarchaeia archaeon]